MFIKQILSSCVFYSGLLKKIFPFSLTNSRNLNIKYKVFIYPTPRNNNLHPSLLIFIK